VRALRSLARPGARSKMAQVTDSRRIVVLGAGAMGTALAVHSARNGATAELLATDRDAAVVDVWRKGLPHPSLRVPFHHYVRCRPASQWDEVLPSAEIVFVAASSEGLRPVLEQAARIGAPDAVWVLATKGWQADTLQTPSEVAVETLPGAPIVSLAGPALAPEILGGSPSGLLCASRDRLARRCAASALASSSMAVFTTSDVAGAETSAAFKNVVAVAVGLAEGLSDRFSESALIANFGNARAAVFARGMLDMLALAQAQGGRVPTVLGLAGAGDLYVTCQCGRNGRFGRLLGTGATAAGAVRSIGSTVEGVVSAAAALRLAARTGLDLPTARAVDLALTQDLTGERVSDQLWDLFRAVVSGSTSRGRPFLDGQPVPVGGSASNGHSPADGQQAANGHRGMPAGSRPLGESAG
jgi:glycerol-3-phosphate dehydrogenase (NAD(P)+)